MIVNTECKDRQISKARSVSNISKQILMIKIVMVGRSIFHCYWFAFINILLHFN